MDIAPAIAASPAAVKGTSEPSRFTKLLAAQHTSYYQTFNNQRAESTNITQPPMATPDQRLLEVKLHLDGREIYRSMIDQERGQEVRRSD